MVILQLNEKDSMSENVKLTQIYVQFQDILKELRKKELPHNIIEPVNKDIEEINSTSCTGNELRKLFKQKQTNILKLLEKELKIVPKDYFRNLWLAVGMCVFGLPIGIIFGLIIMDNAAYLGAGIPIGMCIGIGLGLEMDKKALKDGRQLDLKIKY